MPTTFDFVDYANPAKTWVGSSGTAGWNFTNTAGGAKFTMSDATSGAHSGSSFGNNAATGTNLYVSAAGQNDVISMAITDETVTTHTQFSGTTANKVVLRLGRPDGTGTFLAGTWNVQFMNGATVAASFTDVHKSQVMSVVGQFTGIRFVNAGAVPGSLTIKSLTVNNLNCFCAGTLIDTPDGKRAVETLQAGDILRTADGRETTVKWVGQQAVDTQLTHPKMVNPICVTKGALGPDLPERDLFLSQDHAIAIDGTLYNAGTLVNGDTIYQVADMPLDGFTYYHVETEVHELLLAEGLAAESFIDYAGRDGFDNGAEREGASMIAEMDMPRVSSARMVPAHLKPRKAA